MGPCRQLTALGPTLAMVPSAPDDGAAEGWTMAKTARVVGFRFGRDPVTDRLLSRCRVVTVETDAAVGVYGAGTCPRDLLELAILITGHEPEIIHVAG